MNKKTTIVLIISIMSVLSGCLTGVTVTYKTIKTAKVLLFSFDKNGIFPYLEQFNKNELGISVTPDSIFDSHEIAQSFSFGSSAYAMQDPTQIIYTNAIDSIHVYTLYDFDPEHPAGSNVNDILLFINSMGDTQKLNIHELKSEYHFFKFSAIPQNDSLQFEISGRITNENSFNIKTKLVIIH